MRAAGTAGQASVEVVGATVAMLLAGLVGFQILVAGYAAVMTEHAAEQAALAVTRARDPLAAARSAVPGWPDGRITVQRSRGAVQVRLRPPALFAGVERRLTTTSKVSVRP